MAKLCGDSVVANELLHTITTAFQEIIQTYFPALDSARLKMDEGDLGFGFQVNAAKNQIIQNLQGVRTAATRLPKYISLLEGGVAGSGSTVGSSRAASEIPKAAVTYGENLYVMQDTMTSSRYFAVGDHYDAYKTYWENLDEYDYQPAKNEQTVFIRARDIEGVYLSDREVQNSEGFWTRHGRDGYSQTAITEKAQQVNEAKARYEAGESISALCDDTSIGNAVGSYTAKPIRVSRLGEFYVFGGDGRHRVLASISIDGWIPVIITGELRPK